MIILLYQKSLIIYSWVDTLRQQRGRENGGKVEDRSRFQDINVKKQHINI